jgi:hypothetical protein
MGLGTKNRQKQTAELCKQHLREMYRNQRGLVEKFILEFEGDRKNCDVTRWDRFTDIKDIKKEMLKRLEAHFEISRSGLIRELNEMRANCRRAGKDRQRDWGGCKAGGEGGVGKCARHRRVRRFTVAIFSCHLKNKGNKLSQHLLPRKRAPLFAVA